METNKRGRSTHAGPGDGRAARLPGGRLYTRKVGGEQTGGAYSLFEVEVASGGGEAQHVQHREDECFYVLEGRFAFLVEDEEKIEAAPGSLVYVPKGDLHAFENTGDTTGRLLVLFTPGGQHERFVEEAGGLTTVGAGPESDGRLDGIAVEYGIELVSPHDG